ncbi:TOMM40L [Cordylochernes scorpioides]|uniref:TOMM40L n=1 Tax=Cordylochernes scorpioides TaxID=51811 RepID=A0ABY6LDB2_9ARAC|nr:TOMM40L [Cordylochernes scorpioides]
MARKDFIKQLALQLMRDALNMRNQAKYLSRDLQVLIQKHAGTSSLEVSHSLHMGPAVSGYKFMATYVGTKQVGPNESYPVLISDIDPDGNLNANVIHMLRPGLRSKFVTQVVYPVVPIKTAIVNYNTAQALDISFSSPDIFHKCKWQILKSIGSDHLPILIEISTKTKTSSIKEKFWNFKKTNWNLYQQNTNEDFGKAPTRIKDLEQNWISFKNTIIKAAKVSIPREINSSKHIEEVIRKGRDRLKILKYISGREWGADATTLKLTYTSLIRPILEYGYQIYGTASETNLKSLERIRLSAARIITGLRNTCPNDIVLYETDIMPLKDRRSYNLPKYINKIKSYGNKHRTSKYILNWESNLRLKKEGPLHLVKRNGFLKYKVEKNYLAEKNYPCKPLQNVIFSDTLNEPTNKKYQNPEYLKQLSLEIINNIPKNAITIYTDGSRDELGQTGSGCLIKTTNGIEKINRRNPNFCSVFRSELIAIYETLKSIRNTNYQDIWILTDSNEAADVLAKKGTKEPLPQKNKLTFKEIVVKTKINKNWRIPPKHSWNNGVNPGGALNIRNRQHQTTLKRFRTGHLKPLKIENNNKIYPTCPKCSLVPAAPEHILACIISTKQDLWERPLLIIKQLEEHELMEFRWFLMTMERIKIRRMFKQKLIWKIEIPQLNSYISRLRLPKFDRISDSKSFERVRNETAECVFLQILQGQWVASQITGEYHGSDFTAALALINPAAPSGMLLVAHYLQSVGPRLGPWWGAGMPAWRPNCHCLPGSSILREVDQLLLLQCLATSWWRSAIDSTEGLILWQSDEEHSPVLQLGAEVETNWMTNESVCSLGYQLEVPLTNTTFRGMLTSNWTVSAVMEKKLLPLPFTFALCASLNHLKNQCRLGCAFSIN